MSSTGLTNIKARGAKAKPVATFPTVYEWYGERVGQQADAPQWVGGEMIYYTVTKKLFVQTATSGTTGAWKKLDDTWATTTSTSTSTSTSSTTTSSTTTSTTSSTSTSTSTSTTTSSTSSTTSTSTSTSSTTSTSTSTSSTTTAGA